MSSTDPADLVFLGGRLGRAIRVGEQLGQADLHLPVDRGQAPGRTRPTVGRGHRPGDQHAFRHRLDPQIQLQRRARVDRDQVQSDARRAGHGVTQGEHRSRASPEPRDVDRQRRGRMALRVAACACRAIAKCLRRRSASARPPTEATLARRVVVRAGCGAELVAAAAHRTKGAVEELLELGELVVDVDVALTAQPVGLGVRRVDEPGGFARSPPARPRSARPGAAAP